MTDTLDPNGRDVLFELRTYDPSEMLLHTSKRRGDGLSSAGGALRGLPRGPDDRLTVLDSAVLVPDAVTRYEDVNGLLVLDELTRTAFRMRHGCCSVTGEDSAHWAVQRWTEGAGNTTWFVRYTSSGDFIDVNEAAAAQHGYSRGEAARAMGLALWGRKVGRVFEDGASTDVIVRYADEVRSDRDRLGDVRVPTPSGAPVPLSALAEIRRDRSPNYIMRENVRRRVVVTANVSGRDLRSVAQDVRSTVDASVTTPDGIRIEHAGQFEQEEEATERLLLLGLVVILGIGLIVGATLRSARRTAIVLCNLPLALAGGVASVYLAGGVMSVATTIGFITLFGIATRNGILLATRTADLEAEGLPREEAVVVGARERLSPILMLVSSTALNMVVIPALLSRWGAARDLLRSLVCLPAKRSVELGLVHPAHKLLAVTLALSLSPAFVELVEDGVHLVLEGQTDHADDEDACPEHGCTPTSHHCACCMSCALASAPRMADVPRSTAGRSERVLLSAPRGPRGVLTELERPPRV